MFGTSLNFKRWADLGDGFECEEAPSLADFGLITEKKIAEPDTAIVEPKIFQNTLPLKENAVICLISGFSTDEHFSETFYVHRTRFFACSPPAFLRGVTSQTAQTTFPQVRKLCRPASRQTNQYEQNTHVGNPQTKNSSKCVTPCVP